MDPQKALHLLSSFEAEIPAVHGKAAADYRGRMIDAETVLKYLRQERFRFVEMVKMLENAPLRPEATTRQLRLLDIGIAYGFLAALLQMEEKWKVEGLELTENIPVYCGFAKAHGIAIHPGGLGLEPLPFPESSFDGILFSEVLEHLRLSPSLVIRELRRILTPEGFLLLTTPNVARLANILKLIGGWNVLEKFPDDIPSENITEHLTHIREYTMGELKDLLEQNGFSIVEARFSDCMEKGRFHRWITALLPPWRGDLMVLARKKIEAKVGS